MAYCQDSLFHSDQNNSDDEVECEGLAVYKRIVDAIESQKAQFPALVQRFQLEYWDQPLTFDDALQPYWIDYQIWFQDFTSYAYKNYVDVYATVPPFTQPSDQNEIANPDNICPLSNFIVLNNGGLLGSFGSFLIDSNILRTAL